MLDSTGIKLCSTKLLKYKKILDTEIIFAINIRQKTGKKYWVLGKYQKRKWRCM